MELSKRFGYQMNYHSMEEVFHEIGRLWPAMAGITYHRIRKWGIQWPCTTPDHPGTPYLFKGGFPRGKGRFTAVNYRPSVELPDSEYPFILSTGRQLFQYHTGTMTRRTSAIEAIASGQPYVEIHPEDAGRLNIVDGQKITVSSRRGKIEICAKVTERPLRGMVFIPFHFKEAAANVLTNTATDPVCKIPELKVCAVKIEAE
jgi:formate dehydrogenase major subunit/formate dehydrogenase alpha subunit